MPLSEQETCRWPGISSQRWGMFVYFIGAGEDGPVKIGTAKVPGKRLTELQVGSPYQLRLLGLALGGAAEEARLHKELACYRLRGEWFERAFVLEYMRERGWPTGAVWDPAKSQPRRRYWPGCSKVPLV